MILFEVQTRRENGELRTFVSLADALRDAQDLEVWKISFPLPDGSRVRLVRSYSNNDDWLLANMPMENQ